MNDMPVDAVLKGQSEDESEPKVPQKIYAATVDALHKHRDRLRSDVAKLRATADSMEKIADSLDAALVEISKSPAIESAIDVIVGVAKRVNPRR